MLSGDVELQIGGDDRPAVGLGGGAVGLGADEVDGDREVEAADEVGDEEESAGGDADEGHGG